MNFIVSFSLDVLLLVVIGTWSGVKRSRKVNVFCFVHNLLTYNLGKMRKTKFDFRIVSLTLGCLYTPVILSLESWGRSKWSSIVKSSLLKECIIYIPASEIFIYVHFYYGTFCKKKNIWMCNGSSTCQALTVLWSRKLRASYEWHYRLLLQLRKESAVSHCPQVSFKRDKKQILARCSQASNCLHSC